MYLAEDNIKAFHSFVNFIYRNTLPQFVKDKDQPTQITAGFYTEHKLFSLFYLVEKYCMNELANKVMDAIQDFQLEHDKVPSAKGIRRIYENTRHKSKLRLYGTLCALYQTMRNKLDFTDRYIGLATAFPDFTAVYFILLRNHRDQLSHKPIFDPQIRNDTKGFGKCYFHTH
jgi:hypothetical protein